MSDRDDLNRYRRRRIWRGRLIRLALFVVVTLGSWLVIGVIFAPIGVQPQGEVLRRFVSAVFGVFAAAAPFEVR